MIKFFKGRKKKNCFYKF